MMTSKSSSSTSRYPLKRVRPENENRKTFSSSNGRATKKFCRQPSQDSAFVETEKSSDERAFDLFQREYFPQFRPYFKHSSIVRQLIEHLWSNMTETSKVSFLKKILKDQGSSHLSDIPLNNQQFFDNEENQLDVQRRSSNPIPLSNANKYNRSFLNEFLTFVKHWGTPRFIDENSSTKLKTPLRRSSRIRRAPTKCSCSSCVIYRTTHDEDESSSSSTMKDNQSQEKTFRQLFDYYLQLDDQCNHVPQDTTINDENLLQMSSSIDDNQIQMVLSEIIDSSVDLPSSSSLIPFFTMDPTDSSFSSSIDFLTETSNLFSDPLAPLSSDSLLSSTSLSESIPTEHETSPRRTYVIFTELDEPFFGPFPIEFTITI